MHLAMMRDIHVLEVIPKFKNVYIFVGLGGAMGTLMRDGHAEVRWSTPKCDDPFAGFALRLDNVMLSNTNCSVLKTSF